MKGILSGHFPYNHHTIWGQKKPTGGNWVTMMCPVNDSSVVTTTPPSPVPCLKKTSPTPNPQLWSFFPLLSLGFFAAKVTFHPPRSENRSVPRWYLQTIASVQWQRCRWRTSLGRSVFGSKKVWKAMAFCHLSKNGKKKWHLGKNLNGRL